VNGISIILLYQNSESLSLLSILSSFIHQWLYSSLLGPGLFFTFVIFFTLSIGLLGRVISPSQGRYLHAGQHKHRINAYTDIPAFSGIGTHDPSVRASEDSSCLRPRGHCDWPILSSLPCIHYRVPHYVTSAFFHWLHFCQALRYETGDTSVSQFLFRLFYISFMNQSINTLLRPIVFLT
jgi:hypothetical protein